MERRGRQAGQGGTDRCIRQSWRANPLRARAEERRREGDHREGSPKGLWWGLLRTSPRTSRRHGGRDSAVEGWLGERDAGRELTRWYFLAGCHVRKPPSWREA